MDLNPPPPVEKGVEMFFSLFLANVDLPSKNSQHKSCRCLKSTTLSIYRFLPKLKILLFIL